MGNFLAKPAKWRLLNRKENRKENDEDWATKSNWICNDQLCPNPYTHARGDPCKLTMEDLFPSRPEPPTSEDTKQPEDESEDWLIRHNIRHNILFPVYSGTSIVYIKLIRYRKK